MEFSDWCTDRKRRYMCNIQDGAPKIAKLPYKWLNYGFGRYNYSY